MSMSMRDSSRAEYEALTTDGGIQTGCLQRIADGVEKMTEVWKGLIANRDAWRDACQEHKDRIRVLNEKVAKLERTIERIKRKAGR